tara:strand:- start:92 stop:1327 length:1236 start_codon:yes stop_codon:yes gene_type:complete
MKLLFENWRKYLNEVSYSDAKDILDSKRTIKIIKAYRYDREQEISPAAFLQMSSMDTLHRNFKNYLLDTVPTDLTDNQKGTSVLWLLKISRENPRIAANFIFGRIFARTRNSLETFFHHQQFMPKQDLMQIKNMVELVSMTNAAQEEIDKAQEKKNYLDAEEGTEVLRDDDDWMIAALHNKGAACELGKNTEWCTAAPGLNYFEDYYKEDDPLFYFQQKKYIQADVDRPPAKYQFHYGSKQFMDSKDVQVNKELFETLHDMLIETEAWNKYEKLRVFELERLVKIRLIDGPPAQAHIAEMREILNSLKDPYAMANSLVDMATMQHHNIPTYVLRWLASEEFHKYTGVALRIVRYHEVVPSDILEDIAENNPHQRTRDSAKEVLRKRRSSSHWNYDEEKRFSASLDKLDEEP